MRKVFSVALMAAMLGMVGMTKDAGATVTIALEWAACGGGTGCVGFVAGSTSVTVNPGGNQTLTLNVFLSHNAPGGMSGHGFSLNFDTDLLNELNLGAMGAVEWSGTDNDPSPSSAPYGPISAGVILATPESTTGGVSGRINTIESGGLGFALPVNGAAYSVGTFTATAPARYRVAQVFFVVNGTVANDGADVFSGDFNNPFDALLDSSGLVDITGTAIYGSASVNVVPEPGTVSLLGLGLVGLVLAGRRSRRA